MTTLSPKLDRLSDLIRAANLLDMLSRQALAFARDDNAKWLGLSPKYEKQSRLRSKGANRLRKCAYKLCDEIKECLSKKELK